MTRGNHRRADSTLMYSPLVRLARKKQEEGVRQVQRTVPCISGGPSSDASSVLQQSYHGMPTTSQCVARNTLENRVISSRSISTSSSFVSNEVIQPLFVATETSATEANSIEEDELSQISGTRGWPGQMGGNLHPVSSANSQSCLLQSAVVLVDDGVPSNNIHNDLLRVLALMEDERHLVAYDLYKDAKNRFELQRGASSNMDEAKKAGIIVSTEKSGTANGGGRRSPILDYWMEKNTIPDRQAPTFQASRVSGENFPKREQLADNLRVPIAHVLSHDSGSSDPKTAPWQRAEPSAAATAAAQAALSQNSTPAANISTPPRRAQAQLSKEKEKPPDFSSSQQNAKDNTYSSFIRNLTPDALMRKSSRNLPRITSTAEEFVLPYQLRRIQKSDPGPGFPSASTLSIPPPKDAPHSKWESSVPLPHADSEPLYPTHSSEPLSSFQPIKTSYSAPFGESDDMTPHVTNVGRYGPPQSLLSNAHPMAAPQILLTSFSNTSSTPTPSPVQVERSKNPPAKLRKQQSILQTLQSKWRGTIKSNTGKNAQLKQLNQTTKSSPKNYDPTNMTEMEATEHLLDTHQEAFLGLQQRARLFQKAKECLTVDDDWTLAQTLFGVTTYYRREEDGTLSIKLLGELRGVPLFEQLAVLRECDLFHLWAPFCKSSRKLAQVGKLECFGWYKIHIPVLGTRDGVYRAMGCDTMREDGSIMIVAEGIQDKESIDDVKAETTATNRDVASKKRSTVVDGSFEDTPSFCSSSSSSFPEYAEDPKASSAANTSNKSKKSSSSPALLRTIQSSMSSSSFAIASSPSNGTKRMTIRKFYCTMDILGPETARTRMVVNIDPNLKLLPQNMIDMYTRRIAGILLLRLQAAARKIITDPRGNAHARRMRLDSRFYSDWLLPKFQMYCDELGWEMPKVSAFQVRRSMDSDDDDEEEDWDEEDDWEAERALAEGHYKKRDLNKKKVKFLPRVVAKPLKTMRKKIDHGPEFLNILKSSKAIEAEKKKKIDAARRKARRRLRAKPLNSKQRRRYQELERTKRKLETQEKEAERKRRDAAMKRRIQVPTLRIQNVSRSNSNQEEEHKEHEFLELVEPGRLEMIYMRLVFFADDLYWSAIWPVIGNLMVMFCVFFGNSFVDNNHYIHEFENKYRVLSACVWMSIYAAMHFHVMYTICNVAFDAVEPHLSVGSSGMKEKKRGSIIQMEKVVPEVSIGFFQQGRIFFLKAAKPICIKVSIAISFLCSLYSFLVVVHHRYTAKIRLTISTNSFTNLFRSPQLINQSTAFMNTEESNQFVAYDMFVEAAAVASEVMSRNPVATSLRLLWKQTTLDSVRFAMAYSACFLALLVIFGVLLLDPQQKRRSHKEFIKKQEEMQRRKSEAIQRGEAEDGQKSEHGRFGVLKRLESFHQRNMRGMERIHQRNMKNLENMHLQLQQSPLLKGFETIHQRNVKNMEHMHQRNVRNWENFQEGVKRVIVRRETFDPAFLNSQRATRAEEFQEEAPASTLGKLHQMNVRNMETVHNWNARNWEQFQDGIKRGLSRDRNETHPQENGGINNDHVADIQSVLAQRIAPG